MQKINPANGGINNRIPSRQGGTVRFGDYAKFVLRLINMKLKTLQNFKVKNKKVLLRADLNVAYDPVRKRILNDYDLIKILPTIKYLLKNKAQIILCSHFGSQENYSLAPVAVKLSGLLKVKVKLAPDSVGSKVEKLISQTAPGEIILLENLRFNKGEKGNDQQFAKALAGLAGVFVNDAFGVMHRRHASIVGVPKYLESVAGPLVEQEVKALSKILTKPKRPLVVIVGGVKISSKIATINNLAGMADQVLLGGSLANTFLAAKGVKIGSSADGSEIKLATKLLKKHQSKIILPVDVVVAVKKGRKFIQPENKPAQIDGFKKNETVLDIGQQTTKDYCRLISSAQMIFWGGPLGLIEDSRFIKGTKTVVKCIAKAKAFTVAAGGDTVAAIDQLGQLSKFDFISTGGGATLEFLAGKKLPGLQPLST